MRWSGTFFEAEGLEANMKVSEVSHLTRGDRADFGGPGLTLDVSGRSRFLLLLLVLSYELQSARDVP